jgi:hypothetical protein
MAVTLHEEANGKILILNLTGKLTKEDYQQFVPHVERLIKQHGKVRMLVQMHEFHGWNMGAIWEDLKFDIKHFTHIERLALVGEKRWEAGMAAFCHPFTSAAIRYFDVSEASKATEWIHAGLPASSAEVPATHG